MSNDFICRFNDMVVRTVMLDELVRQPDNPQKTWLVDIEINVCCSMRYYCVKQT